MEQQKAPAFNIPDQKGKERGLEEFKGQKILLYFYPKDMTPGCTTETIGFQDLKEDFKKLNTTIIGISKDSVASHEKFCEKHNLDIILLSDEETTMIQEYGVWQEKSMFGKKYMGISRESFLVDEEGIIMKHWDKVKPAHHPQEVLDYISSL
ncbi:MAG: thioredoxin-dependent thiol peroxidase [Candidatus Pacebacteria bacterium]|nr:thioredoxin-dependent thiol peroxidase [Candidatus Paceibacterota bacterium]